MLSIQTHNNSASIIHEFTEVVANSEAGEEDASQAVGVSDLVSVQDYEENDGVS